MSRIDTRLRKVVGFGAWTAVSRRSRLWSGGSARAWLRHRVRRELPGIGGRLTTGSENGPTASIYSSRIANRRLRTSRCLRVAATPDLVHAGYPVGDQLWTRIHLTVSGAETDLTFGAFYRRLAVRVGKPKAITATARKIAILVYRTLSGTLTYHDPGAHTYNTRQRYHLLRRLRTQADTLGFTLVNRETGESLEGTVS